MALSLDDRIRDTTSTAGLGPFTLNDSPPQGYQGFEEVGDGNTTYYAVTDGFHWEVGLGTYSALNNRLTRDVIYSSSNGDALVNFPAGAKAIFVTLPAKRVLTKDDPFRVADGDYGDVVVSGGGMVWTLKPEVVDDMLAGALVEGTNITIVHDDLTNTYTFSAAGAGLDDAPVDGAAYGRKDAAWAVIDASTLAGGQALTKTDDTNVTLTLGGSPAAALLASTSLTMGWTGTLAVPRGGTGAATLTGYVKGNGVNPFTAATVIPVTDVIGDKAQFNGALTDGDFIFLGDPITNLTGTKTQFNTALSDGDFLYVGDTIPASGITGGQALTRTNDTNVTLTLGGSPTAALLASTSLTMGWTGTLSVPRGGTGAATLTGYLKGNGTSAFTASATIPVADVAGAVGEAPNDGKEYARKNLAWAQVTGFPEAPTDGQTYGRKGSTASWEPITGGGGSFQRKEITATAGQTAFNFDANYAVGSVSVYVNGVRQAEADFTATGGTLVTLSTGVAAGDIVLLESALVAGVSFIPEAPNDGQQYARQSLGWSVVTGGGGGGLPPSTMAQFDTALTDGNFAFQAQDATLDDLTVTGAAVLDNTLTTTHTSSFGTGATASGQTKTLNIGTGGVAGSTTQINYGGAGAIGTTHAFNGTFTQAGGQFTVTTGNNPVSIGSTQSVCNFGSTQTTGAINMGGTTATGAINIGRSTVNQTLDLGMGATASGSTKTINIGANGVSGSTTTISYGSAVAGATTTHTFRGNVGVATAAPASRLHVDDGFFTVGRYGSSSALVLRTAAGTAAAPTAITVASPISYMGFRGYDGTNYQDVASISALSTGAVTSTSAPGYLSFATTPSGAVVSVERARIQSDGNSIFLGQLTATERLLVAGSPTNPFSGVSVQSKYASASQNGTNYVDFLNEGTWPVASILSGVYTDGSSDMVFSVTGAGARTSDRRSQCLSINIFSVFPTRNNAITLGGGSNLWSIVYSATGTINTSDAREKDWRGGLSPAELAAAKDLAKEIGVYRWLSAIEEKGDDARLHVGILAQTVQTVMERHGLDAHRYGFFCWDQWEADENKPAGDRFGVRYDELAMFVAAAQEQRLAALEALL